MQSSCYLLRKVLEVPAILVHFVYLGGQRSVSHTYVMRKVRILEIHALRSRRSEDNLRNLCTRNGQKGRWPITRGSRLGRVVLERGCSLSSLSSVNRRLKLPPQCRECRHRNITALLPPQFTCVGSCLASSPCTYALSRSTHSALPVPQILFSS